MSFWSDLADRISGKSKQLSYQEALKTQEEIANAILAEQQRQNELKYNPELAKQRTTQIIVGVTALTIVLVISIFVYVRYFK